MDIFEPELECVDLVLFLLWEPQKFLAKEADLSLSGCCRLTTFSSRTVFDLPQSGDFVSVQGSGSRQQEEESEATSEGALGPCRGRTPVLVTPSKQQD